MKPHGLVQPAINAVRELKVEYARKVETWEERNDTCVASIFEATKNFPEAFEIVDQYMEEKSALPANAPNKEVLSEDLIDRLTARFVGQLEDEMGKLSSQFTNFEFELNKPVTPGIDRLNGICQKLAQHNRAPTADAKVAKVIEDLQKTKGLENLWLGIVMLPNYTFDTVSQACKRYDGAMEKINAVQEEVHYNDGGSKVVCSYSKCGKAGHTQAQCLIKKRDQKNASLKRSGRQKKSSERPTKGKQAPGNREYRGCFCCGDKDHRADKCPDGVNGRQREEDSDEEDNPQKKLRVQFKDKEQSAGILKYVRGGFHLNNIG